MSLQELMTGLQTKLDADPSKMAGITATYQFKMSGDGGGDYHVVITDGEARLNRGVADNPSITISMDAADFKDLVAGKIDAMSAFITRKLKIDGDISLAMRLHALLG
ncbi:SCP2 sterol-binding domain-containing protein [Desulfoscipio gibsoniae]|uniref:Putative sterol carrier protein n=1 Tax=Desulfoscipio gibsoniae DSM 7213 TaxID=767817 RepID=R4KIR9_9FIRM|nr:SCP2 sterol-binding domain-containing protein [Desulfoscipio gibsoniae]AGL03113.1 putative sterol carrier protein [Desulfoscipio gibsoniae DSM 7213]